MCIILFNHCVPLDQSSSSGTASRGSLSGSSKALIYANKTYESQIKTVQLYPQLGTMQDMILPAVTQLNNPNLILEFDDLTEDADIYNVRILYCNADWSPSSLNTLEYIFEYNEFPINDFEYSNATLTEYVHYTFKLPRVKLPGNYLAVVYRRANPDDIILSRRFMVFDQRINIQPTDRTIGFSGSARQFQQINFNIDYKDYDLINPSETLTIVIRQNQRWDNQIRGIRPYSVREDQRFIEYRLFDDSNQFYAGNEFRFFDLRSVLAPGQNIAVMENRSNPMKARLMTDQSRASQAFAQYNDYNGQFILQNFDSGNSKYESEYVEVEFVLDTGGPLSGDVYLKGAFTEWESNLATLMVYDEEVGIYRNIYKLKQGRYDYTYHVGSGSMPPTYLEGSHADTENEYEIFVYYRPMNLRGDVLIGYQSINLNSRN